MHFLLAGLNLFFTTIFFKLINQKFLKYNLLKIDCVPNKILKFNIMRTIIYKYCLLLSAVALITACENEDIDPASTSNNSGSLTKTKSLNSKSGGLDDQDFADFIKVIMDEETDLSGNYYAGEGLALTESATEYRLRNDEEVPMETVTFDTTYTVNVVNNGGTLEISATDLEQLNQDIHTDLYDHANSYDFNDPVNTEKIISTIDLEWDQLVAGDNVVTLYYGLSKLRHYPTGPCNETKYWHPVLDQGGCNGNPATKGDARQEINEIVNFRNCNPHFIDCNTGHHFVKNISHTKKIAEDNSNYTIKSIYFGTNLTACYSPAKINEWADSCIWISQDPKFLPTGKKLQNIAVSWKLIGSSDPQYPTYYFHTYQYFYAECNSGLTYNWSARPRPTFP